VPILSITVACSGTGADPTSTTADTAATLPTTSTTEPDGSLDCVTAITFASISELMLDAVGEPTPLAAAERYAEVAGQPGSLVETEPLTYSIVEEGREVVLIEVVEAPAGGYLGGVMRGCT
jgi:hypothetical protein